jgi:hypothetical protein
MVENNNIPAAIANEIAILQRSGSPGNTEST